MKIKLAVLGALLTSIYFLQTGCGEANQSKTEASKYNPELLSDEDKKFIKQANDFFGQLPDSSNNASNPTNQAKIALGKSLYYDPRLSKSGVISCNSCHNLASYGVDNLPTSPGHKWTLGARNSPTSLNATFHFAQFWDGRAASLEEQAKGPILNPVEMATPHEGFALDRLKSIPEYKEWFGKAFGSDDTNTITYQHIAEAIACFERTLITPSRFDEYMKGDGDALTDQEKRGMQTFINTGCNTCHMGPTLGGNLYQKFGVTKPYWEATGSKTKDVGRFAVSKNEGEKYYFKVPALRNIDKTYPYFHDGSIWELEKAIAIMGELQLGKKLTTEQVADISAFLKSLTGAVPTEARILPELPASTANTSRPILN